MRKLFFIVTACLTIASTFPAMSRTSAGEGDPIPIRINPPVGSNPPRTPMETPIAAEMEGNTLYISFTGNLGIVDYELENQSTNEIVSDQVEGTGLVLIPFSGDPGSYTITFTLSNGVQFYGEFAL